MKAILPLAGYATRLYPLTKDRPKSLLKVGKKLMVEHILEKIEEVKEIDEVHIVSNNRFYDDFVRWSDSYNGSLKNNGRLKIFVHNDGTKSNDDRLGAVGDIHFGIVNGKIDDDTFVIAGDNLFEFSLNDMVKMLQKTGSTITAARNLKDKSLLANKFGVIERGRSGIVRSFEEKPNNPKSTLAATAVYLYSRDDVSELKKLVSDGAKLDNSGDFIKHLSEKKSVYCYTFDSRWTDIGDHEQLKEAHEYMKRR